MTWFRFFEPQYITSPGHVC